MKIKKAIIPAAGLGTRVLPASKAIPKEMLPLVDKPAIQYIVEEAVRAGIEDILIITNRNKTVMEDHFDRSPELEQKLAEAGKLDKLQVVLDVANLADITYMRQKETRGLGHAVLCARLRGKRTLCRALWRRRHRGPGPGYRPALPRL